MTAPTVRLDGDGSSIEVATRFGPRVVALLVAGRNLFAELPDAILPGPDGRAYRLRGGHRLWAAPEEPTITYQPDDLPCEVTETEHGLRVAAPPDGAGLVKTIEVAPAPGGGWTVDHTIEHRGSSPISVAPWAITQLPSGGRFSLPFPAAREGLVADRSVVLWPYADPADRRLAVAADGVDIDATPARAPYKVGVGGDGGEGTYELAGTRFTKRITVEPAARYPDLGAAVQAYVGESFAELETLGPLVTVPPGGAVAHRERWTIA